MQSISSIFATYYYLLLLSILMLLTYMTHCEQRGKIYTNKMYLEKPNKIEMFRLIDMANFQFQIRNIKVLHVKLSN